MRLKVISTFNQSEAVSQHLQDIAPYDAVSSLDLIKQRPQIKHFKLDWNEATIAPSPKVREALRHHLDNANGLNWYPPLFSPELRQKLSSYTGLPVHSILATNGSDESLELLMKTFLDPGDRIVTPYPTYAHALLFARSRGANIVKVVYPDVFVGDVSKILQAITPRTKMVYLVNPNNPTGAFLNRQEIETVLNAANHCLVIVDEAYFEFSGETMASLVPRYPNLVVTRSFSKAFALAGLRIGYILAHPDTVTQVSRIYNPKSVNTLAQIAAGAALDDLSYYDTYIREVNRGKEVVARYCREHNLEYRTTRANYMLIRVPHVLRTVKELEREGIYVRDRSSIPQLRGFFRFNVGTTAQMEEVVRRMDKVFQRLGIVASRLR